MFSINLLVLNALVKLERESMPALDIFTQQVQQPILLELSGGSKSWTKQTYSSYCIAWKEHCLTLNTCYVEIGLPQSVKSVVKATAFDRGVMGPSMQSVIEVLTHHGIQVESKKMQVYPSTIWAVILQVSASSAKILSYQNLSIQLLGEWRNA